MLTTWVRGLFSPRSTEAADLEDEKYFARLQQILEVEHNVIDARRTALGRTFSPWPRVNREKKGEAQRPMYDATGVALTGGGIRSAAFCLGALQSLAVTEATGAAPHTRSLFDQVDYLSTVSGGGYVGSAVTAAMASPTTTSQKFPFAEFGRFDDEPSVGHLRDFSNYLLPRGTASFADVISVVLRGLVTNLVFILAGILFFATLTVLAYPDFVQVQAHGSFLPQLAAGDLQWLGILTGLAEKVGRSRPFLLTEVLLAIFGLYLIVWAILRSRPALDFGAITAGLFSDVHGVFVRGGRLFVIAIAVAAFFDAQPFALDWFAWVATHQIVPSFAAATGPFMGAVGGAVVALFGNRLGGFLETVGVEPGIVAQFQRVAARVVVWVAAAVLPILLWVAYLDVSVAGMPHSGLFLPGCSGTGCWLWNPYTNGPLQSYFLLWLLFFLPTLLFAPNANSLHQLYRDKLSKAFLFNPANRSTQGQDRGDLLPRDQIELSDLAPATGGPYHLINATINLQGSVQANRHGRDASFFLFSPKFVGSEVTDFVPTELMQKADPHIDLGAAMAISGVEMASNRASKSIAMLTPLLILFNIRFGYWMRNPKFLISRQHRVTFGRLFTDLFKTYLFNEMFGQLDENQSHVYLTHGGHIENLGLYSLLKRHCRLIIVVDGEADPQLTFHALSICERYARIDLGVRLDIPWQQIADVGKAATALAEEGKPIPPTGGPHCTVGSILYPGGERGVLLYVKASLTGDEPDYVVDYKMRNPAFPHESTGDQFFSEEQFEAYRALGFHALDGFLSGKRAFVSSKDVETAAQLAGLGVPDFVRSLMV